MKKRSAHITLLAVIIALLDLHFSYAQSQYRFKHLTAADGLERKYTSSIIQDGRGFLWITDFISLTRFDGYTSKVYVTNSDDSLVNLGHTPMAGFMGGERQAIDANGNLWINEAKTRWDKGYVLKYDQKSDGFIRYKPDLKGAAVSAFGFEKDSPIVWLGTEFGKGLISYNTETNQTEWFLHPHPDSAMNWNRNMICKIRDRQTYLLLATFNGLWKFDKRTKTFSRPPSNPRDSALLYSTPVYGIIDKPFPKDGTVWLEFPSGLAKIDTNFSVIHRFFPKGFGANQIARDVDDVLWIGTDFGVFRYNPADSSVVLLRHTDDPHSLSGSGGNLIVDKDQNVWVASGKGVDQLRRKSLRFYNSIGMAAAPYVEILPELNNEQLISISGDNNVRTAPLRLKDSITFQNIPIQGRPIGPNFHSIWVGKKYVWITTISETYRTEITGGVVGLPLDPATGMIQSGPVQYYSHDPGNPNTIPTRDVLSVYEDPNEDLWVGTFAELSKINRSLPYGTEGSVTSYVHDPANVNSLSMNGIFAMYPGDSGNFWIVTLGGIDLYRHGKIERVFNREERTRTFVKTKDGTMYVGTDRGMFIGKIEKGHYAFIKSLVVPDPIHSMSEDRAGRIWVLGYWGIKCYEPTRDIAVGFTDLDGLVMPDNHGPKSLNRSESGLMVVKGNGISIFDPMSLKISDAKTLPLITSLRVNNLRSVMAGHPHEKDEFTTPVDITELEELVLDYQHNNFSLEFAAMELTAPERNLYQYKLEGYDKNWILKTAKDRTATYTNLPADDYIFKVKASNHHGVWSEQERTLRITILPPPWRTWWAYTGYSLLAIGLLLVARRNIVQRERLKSNFKLEHLELEKAKEVDRVKTSFFTNISHEFRTPLTLIKGPVENLLERFKDDPDVIQRLKLVQRNSDLLLKLINQLLDLARLESGTLKVEKTEADLFSFIRAIASSFESFARQKGVTLSVEVPLGSQSARFDKDKLETILINLINNALKFTPQGGTVTVIADSRRLTAISHQQSELILRVIDTGIGIPTDQQSKIFERFHQVSEAHKEVGTGIGLSLVKELVSLLGGTISVTSEPGNGSEFTVILPLEILATEHHAAESAIHGVRSQQLTANSQQPVLGISNVEHPISNNEPDSSKPQVLVVEDNSDLRTFIIDSLGIEFRFLEAENGVQGLEKATSEVPDLIISDVMMPEMDGITMLAKIKKDIRTSHIPLILLTAKSTEDSKLSGLESGADDYLTKPFNKNELLLKIRNRIEAQAKIREKIKLELLSEGPKVEVQSADEQFLQKVKESILARLSDEQLSVESLADEIGLSRSQLFRKIVALTGVSANELIRKFRLQKAAQLLQQNWGPVSQVAYEVGFSNLSYFSKVFKEEFGVLPSEYTEDNIKSNS